MSGGREVHVGATIQLPAPTYTIRAVIDALEKNVYADGVELEVDFEYDDNYDAVGIVIHPSPKAEGEP